MSSYRAFERPHRSSALKVVRALAGDVASVLCCWSEYVRWNARDVRVDLSSRVSGSAVIEPPVLLMDHCRVGPNASIGAFTYASRSVFEGVTVGRLCSIGPGCLLGPNEHEMDGISSHPMLEQSGGFIQRPETCIGHDVWLGANCVVLRGVSIGHGAVVGANSVVTRDVAEFSVYAGAPAKQVGSRSRRDNFIKRIAAGESSDVQAYIASLSREAG